MPGWRVHPWPVTFLSREWRGRPLSWQPRIAATWSLGSLTGPPSHWRCSCPVNFRGPVVLLGISLTTEDEAGFFRNTVRLSQKVGRWPLGLLLRLLPLMVRSVKIPEPHKRELIEDLKQNRAGDAVRVSAEYLDYIAADRDYAAQLAASGSPAWVVHAERKGDGGLTDAE
jgi:hypothetical protein